MFFIKILIKNLTYREKSKILLVNNIFTPSDYLFAHYYNFFKEKIIKNYYKYYFFITFLVILKYQLFKSSYRFKRKKLVINNTFNKVLMVYH